MWNLKLQNFLHFLTLSYTGFFGLAGHGGGGMESTTPL